MSVRSKFLIIGSVTAVIVLLLMNAIASIIIFNGLEKNVNDDIQKSLESAQAFINDEEIYLALKSKDWGEWDDTYEFLLNQNPAYIERNLMDDTFSNLSVNIIVLVDNSGDIIYARAYDFMYNNELELPHKFKGRISQDDKIIASRTIGSTTSGIMASGNSLLMIASCPVTDSLKSSAAAGTIIVGRYLDNTEMDRMSGIIGESLSVYAVKSGSLPDDVNMAADMLGQEKPFYITSLGSDRFAGYGLLEDIYGSPSLLLKVESVRDIFQQAKVLIIYYLIASTLAGVIALGLSIILQDRLIMRRIAALNTNVKAIAAECDHSKRLQIGGSDEISSLSLQINQMLANLQKSYQQIEEQDRLYKLIADNVSDIVFMVDLNLKVTYFSRPVFEGSGYSVDEVMKLPIEKQITPDTIARVLKMFGDIMKMEEVEPGSFKVAEIELETYRKDGTTLWTHNSCFPMRDSNSKIEKFFCIGRDISKKKLEEKEMLLQRDLAIKLSGTTSLTEAIRLCIDIALEATGFDSGGAYLPGEDGKLQLMCFTGFSSEYIEASGYSKAEQCSFLTQEPVYICMDKDGVGLGEAESREGISAYAAVPAYEKRGILAYLFIASHSLNIITAENRRILGSVANQMGGVVSRLKAEQDLVESEIKYATLVESSFDGVCIIQDWAYKYINRTGARLLGYNREEIVGQQFLTLVAPEWRDLVTERHRKRLSGQNAQDKYEIGMICRDGKIKEVEIANSLISFEGKPAVMSVISDITEKKLWENRRLVEEKLSSIGVLAGGIAHDFNNILSAILGNISLARLSDGQNPEVSEQLEKAEQACARAKDLTHQLLTFAKGGAPVRSTKSMVQLLPDATNFALSGSNVKAEFKISTDLWPSEIDEEQVSSVIHNLVVNADQSMPGGGKIKICAENEALSEDNMLSLPAGRYIKISVIDEGEGISAQNLKYIFDPYFTTRQKGSGLGLAMTYSIIKNHGGMISVDSLVGLGSTFKVYLPASEQSVTEDTTENPRAFSLKGKRILLVDDEEMIRDVTGRILKHMGAGDVLMAGDGKEAVHIYQQSRINGNEIDAIIMDLTIPGGMGGREAMAELYKIDPDVRVVVSSGYASDPTLSDYKAYGFKGVLVKPYKIQELDTVLTDILSAPV